MMIFRQWMDPESATYTYLLACPQTGESVLLDPVLETVDRDLEAVRALGFALTHTLETHIHADHVTGACKMRALTDCKIAGPAMDDLPCRDIAVREGEMFRVGHIEIQPLFTPGHTDTHHAYLVTSGDINRVFTGDALLIDACGRTDFQAGDSATLYRSIHEKIFALPDDTLVYPAHDYEGRRVSSVQQEKDRNPVLRIGRTEEEFIADMDALNLPNPHKMDYAVPANMECGQCPADLPDALRTKCAPHDQG